MPATLPPPNLDANPLPARLGRLRRRLRFVVAVRGLGFLIAAALGVVLIAGLLDWRMHFPSLVRAFCLVGGLTAVGYILYRKLLQPLREPSDDLSLALRIEERYPALNDCLASTIQFLQMPADAEQFGSVELRREAIYKATCRAAGFDFNRIVESRGLGSAVVSAMAAGLLSLGLVLLSPDTAWTALVRLAEPFGATEWPKETRLELSPFRTRVGRNQPFEVHGLVHGVVPEKALVLIRFDGQPSMTEAITIEREEGAVEGVFHFQVRPHVVQKNFQFQIKAHDAATEWHAVEVLPPPLLTALNGRASPQVHLDPPRYTDLPPQDLPDGSGNIDAIRGTIVTLRAAVDHPLTRAWIEYQPDPRAVTVAAGLAPMGSRSVAEVLSLQAGGQEVWTPVPAQIGPDPHQLQIRFTPCVSGHYALHFEDDTGLTNVRHFELRVQNDPAPEVKLERPSTSRDVLSLLPSGELTLDVSAVDLQYAVRALWLNYRFGPDGPMRRVPLFEHQTYVETVPLLMGALSPGPVPPRFLPLTGKLPLVHVAQRLPLARLRELDPDHRELHEGDVILLQALATDFDDVSVDKQPGQSLPVEIRIVSRNTLDLLLNHQQQQVQEKLVELRQWQREAEKMARDAEAHWKRDGKLPQQDLENLPKAEQMQQQIRDSVGPERQEALRGQVDRILQTLRDNNLPRTAVQERMEAVAEELTRLAREELPQIEKLLTDVRKQLTLQEQTPKDQKQGQQLLTEARLHQEEVEKTFNDLLSRLEPWTSTREIKGEAKALLQEQKQVKKGTDELLNQQGVIGSDANKLTPAQQEEKRRLEQAQQKLEERTAQLLQQMDRVAEERKAKDPETAEEIRRAAEQGKLGDVPGLMQQAREALNKNQLSQASDRQKQSLAELEKLVKNLEDRRDAELDRLVKKLREAENKLAELFEQQEKLQKKAKDLQQQLRAANDPQEKQRLEEELKKLGREQEKLNQQAQEMVKELSRLRVERASQALGKAAEPMQQAGQQLGRGGKAEDQQDEALDRIDDAQRELEKAREQAEEQLAREQLTKVQDQLKALKERHERMIADRERLEREALQKKLWDRRGLASLLDLSKSQKALGDETKLVADTKLDDAIVFANILRKAAKAMTEAGEHVGDRVEALKQKATETEPDEELAALQKDALLKLQQLIDALKPEDLAARKPGGKQEGGEGGQEGGGEGGGPGGMKDGIPYLAELKLLRELQADVNKKTELFQRRHPDLTKLDDKAQTALKSLRRDQQEVADLLEELTKP